jgi:hypothetical protein
LPGTGNAPRISDHGKHRTVTVTNGEDSTTAVIASLTWTGNNTHPDVGVRYTATDSANGEEITALNLSPGGNATVYVWVYGRLQPVLPDVDILTGWSCTVTISLSTSS